MGNNVDALTSTLFVVLSFKFANRWYMRLCGCLDTKCLKWWKKVSADKYQRNKPDKSTDGTTPNETINADGTPSTSSTSSDGKQMEISSPRSPTSMAGVVLNVLSLATTMDKTASLSSDSECVTPQHVICNIGEKDDQQVKEQQNHNRNSTTLNSIDFAIQESVLLNQLFETLTRNMSDGLGEELPSP